MADRSPDVDIEKRSVKARELLLHDTIEIGVESFTIAKLSVEDHNQIRIEFKKTRISDPRTVQTLVLDSFTRIEVHRMIVRDHKTNFS